MGWSPKHTLSRRAMKIWDGRRRRIRRLIKQSKSFAKPTLLFKDASKTMIGINSMQPFGYAASTGAWGSATYTANPYVNGGADTTVWPNERLDARKANGYDFIRMAVDVGPLCAAANDATLDDLISQIITGATRRMARGLKVIVDLHVLINGQHPVPGWDGSSIIAGGVNGIKFQRLIYVAKRLASQIWALRFSTCNPTNICLELFNEPPFFSEFTASTWTVMSESYWAQVRSVCGLTLLIGGTDYNSLDSALSGSVGAGLTGLRAAKYDENTIFVFHPYEAAVFTHQGITNSVYEYAQNLTYPAWLHPGGLAKAKADFTTLANAAGNASALNSVVTQDGWASSLYRYFYEFGNKSLLAKRIKIVTDWADAAGISRKQLGNSESGVNHQGANDASAASMSAWIRDMRENAQAAGIGFITIHEEQGSSFAISDTTSEPWTHNEAMRAALFDPLTSDTTPVAFTFTDVSEAAQSNEYLSNAIVVDGVTAPTSISITGGSYSVNGGSFTTSPGLVNYGDFVIVKVTSSPSASTSVNAILTIGGISDTYTVTTGTGSSLTTVETASGVSYAQNRIPNYLGTGAANPSTLPTGWSQNLPAGIALTVVGSGVSGDIQYVDFRFNGTSSAGGSANLYFCSGIAVNGVAGDVMNLGGFFARAAGSISGLGNMVLYSDFFTAAGAYISGDYSATDFKDTLDTSIGSGLKQRSVTVSGATVEKVTNYLSMACNAGQAIDITIRVAYPFIKKTN